MHIRTIKVSDKGQIALPKEVRDSAHIREGDTLLLIEKDGKVMLENARNFSGLMADEFKDLVKHSSKVAHKLWGNKADEHWNKL